MNKIILFSIFYFLFSILAAPIAFGVGILGPLVPCGGEGQPDCTWCLLYQLGKNIIDFLMIIVIPISVAMVVYGGIMIMIAAGSPEKAKSGREIVRAAVVGLLIALLAWLILDTIFKIIAPGFENIEELGPWNKLKC